MSVSHRIPGSFRDPSGFLFVKEGKLYRQVNSSFEPAYRGFMASGLYDELVEADLLIPHQETKLPPVSAEGARIIEPELVPFISYPYEWSFSQLRLAALTTLEIMQRALERGFWLKDAANTNLQFRGYRPTFIDTLSFEPYPEGSPWVAYRQFCQHFLAPLALMAHRDVRFSSLLRTNIDGIPLDLASTLLPLRSKLRFGLLSHLVLHAGSQRRHATSGKGQDHFRMNRRALDGLIDSLTNAIRKLTWKAPKTQWGDYYSDTNYTEAATKAKEQLIQSFLSTAAPDLVWDLGGNDGRFSRLASSRGATTVAFDLDPLAVDRGFRASRKNKDANILHLLMDLTNPSPSLGWAHEERPSLANRGPADLVMALALIHHLAIGNNVPLARISEWLSELSPWLIVEWIPKEDTQVERLLASRKDIFLDYDQPGFERAFEAHYETLETAPIPDSKRVLYLMRVRSQP